VGELGAAIARLLAGDVAGARVAAERGSSPHAALLRAELALPDRAAAARHARDALAAAERAHDALAGERARWLLVALGDDAATVASGAERPRVPDLGPLDLPISAAARAADVADSIATWAVWRAGSSEERRAARYALLEHRDVYPASLAAYVFAAGQLVDEPAEVEPWLDVVMARFEPRIGLRRYAFVRWRVARWRGDVASSRWWRRRFDELAARLADGGEAELWQALGL
jgi:hypothetical protein